MSNAPFQALLMVNSGADILACTQDDYWDNTVLLLHFDGVNNGTIFVDSGPKSKDLVVAGSVITRTDIFKFGQSADFGSSGGAIATNVGTDDFAFGTGDFTVELWIRTTNLAPQYVLDNLVLGDGGTWALIINAAGDGTVGWWTGAGVGTLVASSTTTPADQGWVHIAVVRESGALGIYVNGTLETAVADATDYTDTVPYFLIANQRGGTGVTNFDGQMDELRITKGVARYTGASFDLATLPFCNFQGDGSGGSGDCVADEYYSCESGDPRTVLSLHAEDTEDSSCYQPKTITLLGSAVVSTDQFKFGTSSFYIPNTGVSAVHGLSIADHGDFDFGTLDFTIEMWAYRSANTYKGYLFYAFFTNDTYATVGTDGLLDMRWGWNSSSANRGNLVSVPLSQWNFFVFQRRGGTSLEVFLNGVLVDSYPVSAAAVFDSVSTWYLGRQASSSAESWNGYIDEVRITRGVARYFGEIWSDVTLDNTVMLWRNGVLADESSNSSTITAVGTVTLDERGFTPAASSYIRAEIGAAGSLIGDFLFELVCREGWNNVFFMATGGGYLYNGNFESYGGSNLSLSGVDSTRVQVLAISRVGTTLRSFINGVEQASVTYAGVIDFTELQFGRYIPNNNLYFNGTYYGARLLTGVGYDANYEVEKWFNPAALPNCDSTGGSGTPTPGWAPLTGIAMSAETGGINQTDWFAALTGQQMTAGQGGLTPPGTAYNLPIGVNATYTSSRALASSSATTTSVEININFRYRGDVYFKIVAGTENTFGWLAPVDYSGSVISSTDCLYEVRFTRLDSSTFVEGANTFTPGTWYTGSNIESKYLDYTSSFALAASDTSASQQLSLRIQVRPTAASGLSGAAYERDYVLNFVGLVTKPASAGATYPDLQDSSHTLNNTSTYYVDFKSDGTVRSHTGATIGRWIDADPLLPGIANQFKLQVSADPIPAGYTRVSNTLINAYIKSNLSTTNRFDFASIAPSEVLSDLYRAFTVRAVPLLSNPRYGESGYYSIHTFAIFSPNLGGGV